MAAPDRDALRSAGRRAFDLVSGTPTARIALMHLGSLVGPEHLAPELRDRAAAEAEPVPFKDIEAALKRAWGRPPSRVLDGLDREPAAVTPGSQVHRGEDEDGRAVAVKVLRPGIAEVVRSDLAVLEPVASVLGSVLPRMPLGAIVREVRERILDELDLEHEAATQRRVARALRGHERLHVPMPRTDLCADRVKVAEWVDGTSVRELAGEDDRRRAAEGLVTFVAGLPRLAGVAHADPHPDDVLLLPDGRVAVVDFGAARDVPRERVDLAAAALDAFADRDADALAAALSALRWLPDATAEDAEDGLRIADDAFGGILRGEVPLDAAALDAAGGRLRTRHADAIARRIPRVAVPPEDLWPLRGLGQLGLVLARLGVRADWVGLARGALAG